MAQVAVGGPFGELDLGDQLGFEPDGINSWVSNEIGTGITPRSLAPDENFRARANELSARA